MARKNSVAGKAVALALAGALTVNPISAAMIEAGIAPAVPLYQYQLDWINDKSRFKIGMFARQTGKTFTTTLEIVDDVFETMAQGKAPTTWVILSRGERQSREAFALVKRHAQAYSMAVEEIEGEFKPADGENKARYTQLEAVFADGSRIIALPANPDTARGYSANVFLDEFAVHQDSREIFGALFFLISAGYKLRITSTPKGRGNKFYEIWHQLTGSWSRHKTDIYQAVAQGLDRDIEELKTNLNDQELWEQEAELKFVDEATSWLTQTLMGECSHVLASDPKHYQGGECAVGVDIGLKHDRFVIQVLERVGEVWWHREEVVLHKEKFKVQDEALALIFKKYRVTSCYMDETGIGAKPVEDAQRNHGAAVLGVVFSVQSKLRMATAAKRLFEQTRIRIGTGQDALRDDIMKVKKDVTGATVRLIADSDSTGHADRAWALFLACMAADSPMSRIAYESATQQPSGKTAPNDDDDVRSGGRTLLA